jgi:hypothetical protein
MNTRTATFLLLTPPLLLGTIFGVSFFDEGVPTNVTHYGTLQTCSRFQSRGNFAECTVLIENGSTVMALLAPRKNQTDYEIQQYYRPFTGQCYYSVPVVD